MTNDDFLNNLQTEVGLVNDSNGPKRLVSTTVQDVLFSPEEEATEHSNRKIESPTQSVYEAAANENKSLREWIAEDPDYAIRYSEAVFVGWSKLYSQAATTGTVNIMIDGEEVSTTVSRQQAAILSDRIRNAKLEMFEVRSIASRCVRKGELKKDRLIRSMYDRALEGDDRMAMYLIDRNDGRTPESVVNVATIGYDGAIYNIICSFFKKQMDVLNSGNGTKLICCSRRAGKTHLLVGIMMVECLRKPRTKCMYIGETAELSEGLIDKAANDIIDICNLRDSKGNRLNWKKFDNGSEIMVRGLSNTKDPDQIRGYSAKIIVIDEFFHLKSELLEYLQKEVLEPMQMDYADDYKFICAGTPPRIKGTYGEYVWKNWDCDHFEWTWRDNPHPVSLEKRKEYIEGILKGKGLDWESSFARREYNGEWAYDDDLLLYPEVHCYNPAEGAPNIKVTKVLFGIDYGVGDNDTLFGIAWSDTDKRGYQFWEDKFNRLDIKDRSISQLEYLCTQVASAWRMALEFFPLDSEEAIKEANKRILWDADDNDQHLTDYMNVNVKINEPGFEHLKLNIQNAHKTDKTILQDAIRDCLRRADLLLIENGKAVHECTSTILKRGPNGEVFNEIDDKVFHPDLLPAMRYAMYNVLDVA